MKSLIRALKLVAATVLFLISVFMLSVSIEIAVHGYKPSLILSIPLTLLPFMAIGWLYPDNQRKVQQSVGIGIKNASAPVEAQSTAPIPVMQADAQKKADVANIKPNHSPSANPVQHPAADRVHEAQPYRPHSVPRRKDDGHGAITASANPTQAKLQINPQSVTTVPTTRRDDSIHDQERGREQKIQGQKNSLKQQLESVRRLQQDVQSTLSTVRSAASAASAASSVEFLDMFTKNKWISGWSTLENNSARSSISQAQSALEKLSKRIDHFETKSFDAASDWVDLYVDLKFSPRWDVLSYFNFDSLNSSSIELGRAAADLQQLLSELEAHESDLELQLDTL